MEHVAKDGHALEREERIGRFCAADWACHRSSLPTFGMSDLSSSGPTRGPPRRSGAIHLCRLRSSLKALTITLGPSNDTMPRQAAIVAGLRPLAKGADVNALS